MFYRDAGDDVHASQDQPDVSEAHADQVLAMLGYLGLSAETPLGEDLLLSDAIVSNAKRFSFQKEYEWSVLALLHYLPPIRQWVNRWGKACSFDAIAHDLFRRPWDTGACNGSHLCQLAASMLNIAEQYEILTDRSRNKLHAYLADAAGRLANNQQADGGWGRMWSRPIPAGPQSPSTLHMTGHHLEWLLLVRHLHTTNPTVIERGIDYCRSKLLSLLNGNDDPQISLCPLVHAVKTVIEFDRLGEEATDEDPAFS
ncbi:hypothetical protein [Crateriforma conspicua]|uniref:hypothetical protein n=1 Tax=Crateriforma conspicua TaxID=2527996 RepID=UPI0018CDEBA6|nr:hypothetical protein [Crateriforma conspicua]